MIKCLFNNHDNIKKLKQVHKTDIFECTKHQIAIISHKKNQNIHPKIYNFEQYQKNENRLHERYKKLIINLLKLFTDADNCCKQKTVLDVGAGYGLFSSLLLETGQFRIEALEPNINPYYLENTSAIIHKNTLEKFLRRNKIKYDLILLMDVLEHLQNPLDNLQKLKSILTHNGRIVIQTPNYQSLMAKICTNWAWWMVEDHKFVFSPNSLRLLVKKAGYDIEYRQTYEDWCDFKKNLDGNFEGVKNKYVRKIIKAGFFTLFLPFYFIFRILLWKGGYGGLIFLVVK